MKRLAINVGFITNSSSCVYCFPQEILDDPEVSGFLNAYGFTQDIVGAGHRGSITFVQTEKGWNDFDENFRNVNDGYYQTPGEPGDVLVMVGDESPDTKPFVQQILEFLRMRADTIGVGYDSVEVH